MAIAAATPILTPTGWRPAWRLAAGDRVITGAGEVGTVVAVETRRDAMLAYARADGGPQILVDAEQLWRLYDDPEGTLQAGDVAWRPAGPADGTLAIPTSALCRLAGHVERYVLPLLSQPIACFARGAPRSGGDSATRTGRWVAGDDAEGEPPSGVDPATPPEQRRVPAALLWGPGLFRRAVLDGILAAATVQPGMGGVSLGVVSERLVDDVEHLAYSLGGWASRRFGAVSGRPGAPAFGTWLYLPQPAGVSAPGSSRARRLRRVDHATARGYAGAAVAVALEGGGDLIVGPWIVLPDDGTIAP